MYKIPFLYDYVFPNLTIPNAIMPEMGIVNYIHTLYSNRIKSNSFFEENFLNGDSFNNLTRIFGKELGNFPNSLGYETHLKSGCYNSYLTCEENSVYFGKRKYNKYIYPILVSPHFENFTGVNIKNFSKLNGEYFWKHMSAESLEDARSGRAIIFLDYGQENFIEKENYYRLHHSLVESKIPTKNIILAFNSFNAKEIYENWFSENDRKLEVHNWPMVVANSSFHFNFLVENESESCVTEKHFLDSKNSKRQNKFLFKIRRPRPHRMALLFYLHQKKLLQYGDWSFLYNLKYDVNEIKHLQEKYNIFLNEEEIKDLYNFFPRNLSAEKNLNYNEISAWNDVLSTPYENSYFYICTETFTEVHGEYKSITEKIFKPIVNFLPFIFVAYPGALSLLRELGFKTFHPFIDESYDLEKNESKRLKIICNEIEKLCNKSTEELHTWYWELEDILLHNRNHAINLYKNESISKNFIEYLYKRVNE